ncbi:MAG: DUF2834 domain-containing protein [Rhodobacteraceae bacterium]|nr:DUF2834 domain-containing protein [Paracoccaceae bacterium]
MSKLRMIYLALAIAGTILPMWHFLAWFAENETGVSGMIAAWQTNTASTGLFWDIAITAMALIVWIVAEVYVRRDYWVALICLPLIFLIGVSCAFPLYLFLRARPVK